MMMTGVIAMRIRGGMEGGKGPFLYSICSSTSRRRWDEEEEEKANGKKK